MDEIVGLAPSGSMGSGYNLEAFKRGIAAQPHFIGQDAGSTDMGPYYHGTGATFLPLATYRHDLAIMLRAARAQRIPLLVGSALTSGANGSLAQAVEIVRALAREDGLSFRMAVISAEIDKSDLKRRLAKEPFESIGPGPLTPETIERCGPIVAQMGVEPFMKALDAGAEVIIAGRACDDVIFAALPMLKGFDAGLSLHCGKILECAGLSAVPTDLAEPLLGRVRRDHFEVEPCHPDHRCTTVSVAGHSLYERGDPCLQPGPGGMNDLTNAVFTQVDARRVQVSGSRFVPDARYRVKLEGAEKLGYRSIVLVGIRDPFMIEALDPLFADVRERAEARFGMAAKGVQLNFSVYGKNAVMGALEPVTKVDPHEVGLLIDAVAPEQDLATAVAMFVRGTLQHASYPGIRNTAGNMAYPFSPFGLPLGPAYRFAVYHLMPLEDACECFPMTLEEVRN
ncbi:MAG: acyclic terpene utilization AtuA family protein [Burkholderiales bacterium]|nr:acyclic terpene utilization AtuA family protein [Burkholderiales bacterium]